MEDDELRVDHLRLSEDDVDGFSEPVVRLWWDKEFVGQVYWDGDEVVVQIHSDDDGEPFDLSLGPFARALVEAEQIVNPNWEDELDIVDDPSSDEDELEETTRLVSEFDSRAVHRSDGGEGYFDKSTSLEFIDRCDELRLGVTTVEGFDYQGRTLKSRPSLIAQFKPNTASSEWANIAADLNDQAREVVSRWSDRDTLVVAFVVMEPTGESFIA
ncbi:MAG: hypothetical protein HKN07_13325 [Acidimicrobiia bacterium]|nr:hypothetical protein [Acidimicrobiia bacterium]